jgi:protein-tyrosine phosphatase
MGRIRLATFDSKSRSLHVSTLSLRVAAAATLCAALTVGAVAGTASAAPSSHTMPAASIGDFNRSLGLQGAVNARDVGGYRTTDGHTVRTGLVFRSNALNSLTPADLAHLTHHNVRVIEDLRTVYERAIAPDRVPAGTVDNWNDVLGQTLLTSIVRPADAYSLFITAPGANRAFGNVLRDIIHTNGAVLYHCSEGKDRTGWTTAVLLTVLGVDRFTVDQDFLLSNKYLHAAPGDIVGGVALDELNTGFTAANQRYGSFDNYVREGLGLTNTDIAALKAKLLV